LTKRRGACVRRPTARFWRSGMNSNEDEKPDADAPEGEPVPPDAAPGGGPGTEHDATHLKPVRMTRGRAVGAQAVGVGLFGAVVLGAVALGALAIGALAIGRLGIGRFGVGEGRIDRLKIGRLEIGEVKGLVEDDRKKRRRAGRG
jgi:hypothetical protein